MAAIAVLLATKLHRPRPRRALVSRPRLVERMNRAHEVALTVVSAPPGFGKTTMLSQWVDASAAAGRSVAWLTLDQRDDDPARFWSYLVAAVRTVRPEVGGATLALLASSAADGELVPVTLVNELADGSDDFVLVLDDYHAVESADVRRAMAVLFEHLPANVHLVLAGRADPTIPLSGLRARGDLLEIRATDLRFSPDESAAYLAAAVGRELTGDDIAALDRRTEGWVAALQLAALSLQGRPDAAGFIAEFAGDDRYVVDYLVEEVLARQPPSIRRFLLQTSILNRLSGPLCDAVTGGDDGRDMLRTLERGNLFLLPLDDRRRWYRYHQLFADMLRAHLADERPDAVADLHRRAAQWHDRNGERAEAVGHALAGGDVALAADLIERALPDLQRDRQESTMHRWLAALPDEMIRSRPALSVGYAASLMVRGELEGVEQRLRDAERRLGPIPGDPSGGPVDVVDEADRRRLSGAIALYRAAQAHLRGDIAGTVTHARAATELAGSDNDLARGAAAGLLGLAQWSSGDLTSAHRWWTESATGLERAGHRSDVAGCALALSDILVVQGDLDRALATCERVAAVVAPASGPVLRGAGDMDVAMAAIAVERDDLTAARRHLAASAERGEHLGLPQNAYRWRVVMARVCEADGDPDGALALLADAERRHVADYFPPARPVAAVRARVLARQGRWAESLSWAARRGLSADDLPDHLTEFEHLTLARALVARHAAGGDGDPRPVAGLTERVRRAAQDAGRIATVIDALVVRSVASLVAGDTSTGLATVVQALELAEPQRFARIFLDEGRPMIELLSAVAGRGPAGGYAGHLLARAARTAGGPGDASTVGPVGLVDPLSARELDVLRLLGTELDGPDIARALFLSVNTIRTHTKNIYAKLGVTNRRAAVRRGAQLRLLPPDRPGSAG